MCCSYHVFRYTIGFLDRAMLTGQVPEITFILNYEIPSESDIIVRTDKGMYLGTMYVHHIVEL